jgi:transcriptional regulator with XRE-family HTH domain
LKSIRMFRERARFKQRDLERESGVSQSMISLYETGALEPSPKQVARIAKALGVTEYELRYADSLLRRRESTEAAVEEFARAG